MSEAAVDERTPVIVGVAHEVQRPGPPEEVVDAVTLMIAALAAAGADSGCPAILEDLDHVAVVQGLWRWPDPGRMVADAVGAPRARTALAPACGSTPQVLVADAAARILDGRAEVVAVCGGEWVSGRAQLRAAGLPANVTQQHDGKPDEVGEAHAYESALEIGRGFDRPLFVYPLMESASRHQRGESIDEDRERCAGIVSRLSEVAATNPAAWTQQAWTPGDVNDVRPGNRMVAFPYTKRMVSNERVDMASAIVLTSAGTARRLGIGDERWVFPHGTARLTDLHMFSELDRLDASADMALTCRRALELTGTTIDDFALLELYSCFPAAVQIEADTLGIRADDPRPLTVSGGMPTFGGPIANYVGHTLVDMVLRLRREPGEKGLCVANGGYLNRPAVGVYGTRPPARPFRDLDLAAESTAIPRRRVLAAVDEPLVIESITAIEMPGKAPRGLATGLTRGGQRGLGWTEDADLVEAVRTVEQVGRRMTLSDDGQILAIS